MSKTNELVSDSAAIERDQPQPTPVLKSTELLRDRRVVLIEHAGEVYRLLVTKNDKLMLQK